LPFSTRPNEIAHKQHHSKKCKSSSLHILLKRSDDGIRLMQKLVVFWTDASKVVWMKFYHVCLSTKHNGIQLFKLNLQSRSCSLFQLHIQSWKEWLNHFVLQLLVTVLLAYLI
jgi:hypothetical protein